MLRSDLMSEDSDLDSDSELLLLQPREFVLGSCQEHERIREKKRKQKKEDAQLAKDCVQARKPLTRFLKQLYRKKDRSKVGNIPRIMEVYEGVELMLMQHVQSKYKLKTRDFPKSLKTFYLKWKKQVDRAVKQRSAHMASTYLERCRPVLCAHFSDPTSDLICEFLGNRVDPSLVCIEIEEEWEEFEAGVMEKEEGFSKVLYYGDICLSKHKSTLDTSPSGSYSISRDPEVSPCCRFFTLPRRIEQVEWIDQKVNRKENEEILRKGDFPSMIPWVLIDLQKPGSGKALL